MPAVKSNRQTVLTYAGKFPRTQQLLTKAAQLTIGEAARLLFLQGKLKPSSLWQEVEREIQNERTREIREEIKMRGN